MFAADPDGAKRGKGKVGGDKSIYLASNFGFSARAREVFLPEMKAILTGMGARSVACAPLRVPQRLPRRGRVHTCCRGRVHVVEAVLLVARVTLEPAPPHF